MNKPENHILVIFGASGDLTKRKLIPALYSLDIQNLLPEKFAVIGVSRTELSDDQFRAAMKNALHEFSDESNLGKIDLFSEKIFYQSVDAKDVNSFNGLENKLSEVKKLLGIEGNTIFYLSTPPSLYGIIPPNLAAKKLNTETEGWKKLIIEKPFGYDKKSSLQLSNTLEQDWQEDQIYRIDHYLGKETVQNVLVTRFANGFFEPLWNRNFIDHIEITSAENIGVEKRGGYYDGSGALRDMVQNHLLQLVGLIAMESPASIDSDSIRNETVKVFKSIKPFDEKSIINNTIRGQYLGATIKGEMVKGYREEEGVVPNSKTETYAALKFYIDNWRWGGVPFYIRTGKRLPTRVTEAVIHFKATPHFLFSNSGNADPCNQLILRIQPDEGILLKFGMKTPGAGFEVQTVNMDFHYSELSHQRIPNAYERLLYDCMIGDSTLYARNDAVMAAWDLLDPLLEQWKNNNELPIYGYPSGTWGPETADDLIEGKNIKWRYPCKNLSNDGIYCEL